MSWHPWSGGPRAPVRATEGFLGRNPAVGEAIRLWNNVVLMTNKRELIEPHTGDKRCVR